MSDTNESHLVRTESNKRYVSLFDFMYKQKASHNIISDFLFPLSELQLKNQFVKKLLCHHQRTKLCTKLTKMLPKTIVEMQSPKLQRINTLRRKAPKTKILGISRETFIPRVEWKQVFYYAPALYCNYCNTLGDFCDFLFVLFVCRYLERAQAM